MVALSLILLSLLGWKLIVEPQGSRRGREGNDESRMY